jgi:hypothetical protein
LVSQPDPTAESPVTAASRSLATAPFESALHERLATGELHHHRGRDPRKSPLNIFWLRELTLALSRNNCDAGGGDGVPCGIFSLIIKSLTELKLLLTCRQGDFAEDLSEEGM